MKKTILTFAAIFIATQLFSQDVDSISTRFINTAKNKIASFFMYLFVRGNKLQRKVPEQTSMQHQPNARLKVFCSYVILV